MVLNALENKTHEAAETCPVKDLPRMYPAVPYWISMDEVVQKHLLESELRKWGSVNIDETHMIRLTYQIALRFCGNIGFYAT